MEEKLTGKQAFAFVIIFLVGETLMAGANKVLAEENEWVVQLAAFAVSLILFAAYLAPFRIFPDKSIFEIFNTVLGKIFGRVAGIIFAAAAFLNGVFVMRLVAEFIIITSLEKASRLTLCLLLASITALMVSCGISKMGRMAQFCFPVLLIFSLFYLFGAVKNIYLPIFRPDFSEGIAAAFRRGYEVLNCPFSQTVFFVGMASITKSVDKNKKSMFAGYVIGGAMVALAVIRNVFVLGSTQFSENYFPSYVSASVIEIGDFFKHGEIFVAIVLFCSNILQISSCIACACGGITQTLNIKDYKKAAVYVGAAMLGAAVFAFDSTMSVFNAIKHTFKYFSWIIIVAPIVFWIYTEIYGRVKHLPKAEQ